MPVGIGHVRKVLGVLALGWVPLDRARGQECSFSYVDLTPAGGQPNGFCYEQIRVSSNGRFVAFESHATDIVPGDTNGHSDVFLLDRLTGVTERVSVGSAGVQANGASLVGDISSDGRFVTFLSGATNLAATDPSSDGDVYLRDRLLDTTEHINVSMAPPGVESEVFGADVSDDGRYVVFSSTAPDLVPGDDNGWIDVFSRDRLAGTTTLVSVDSAGVLSEKGGWSTGQSGNGRRVAFVSRSTNLHPLVSDGRDHGFVHDLDSGRTEPIDVSATGELGDSDGGWDARLSYDGRTVAFVSTATNLLTGSSGSDQGQGFVRDLLAGTIEGMHFAEGATYGHTLRIDSISRDARYILFRSSAPGWLAGDPLVFVGDDVFLYDRSTRGSSRVSSHGPGQPPNQSAWGAAMSGDASVIAFVSGATNLADGPTTLGWKRPIVRSCSPAAGLAYCAPSRNTLGCLPVILPSGIPSASAASGHLLTVEEVVNQQLGLFLYGTRGSQSTPFAQGILCIAPPLEATSPQTSGGGPVGGNDCSGSLRADFNAWIASGRDPSLSAGSAVYVQAWYRDPGSAEGSALSSAAMFLVGP